MLKFESPKQFHAKHGKVFYLKNLHKMLKWFGG
jgi:hypothetical protein